MTRFNVLNAGLAIAIVLGASAPVLAEAASSCPTKQSQTTCPAPQNNNHQHHH